MDATYPQSELGASSATREAIQELISTCTNELQQELIEQQHRLALFDRRIADLRYRLNVTAPIARLPSETLALVFEAYAEAFWHRYTSNQPNIDDDILEYIGEEMPEQVYRRRNWFAILHVCRHWRNAALSTHRLWARIIPGSKLFVEQAISRSGCVPLCIGLADPFLKDLATRSFEDHLNVEPYTSIFPELRRIRTLRLPMTCNMEETMSRVFAIRPVDAPLLEELQVRFFQGVQRLPHLPTLALPKLRKLCLSMAPLSIVRAMVRPTLTHLRLSGKLCELGLLPFLEVLDKLPNLEDLFLCWVEHIEEDYNLVAPQPMLLPRLQRLTLVDRLTGWHALKILEHCIFPATTVVYFRVGEIMDDLDLMFPPLAQKLLVPDRKDAPPFLPQSMRISDEGFCFELWPSVVPGTPDKIASDAFDLLEAQYLVRIKSDYRPSDRGRFSSMRSRFLTSLNVGSSLVSICVNTWSLYGAPTSDWWFDTFSGMTCLETLCIDASSASETTGFLEAFGTGSDSDATEQTPSYLFPQLKSLEISIQIPLNDHFSAWREPPEDTWAFPSQAILHLGSRQREGPRLPLLKILFRPGCEKDVEVLRQAEIADHREVIILPPFNDWYLRAPKTVGPICNS
ncbi:hypothetical protein EIP86_010751 [Pleurotus ostreatoroseus]|nr:hypothetical protein EIP86_010751 [Pleurotus ostreatoroseus]